MINNSICVVVLASAVIYGTPLLYAALGELLAERSGVLNLGVEGMMLDRRGDGLLGRAAHRLARRCAIVVAAVAGGVDGADPRVPRDHAAREPDRLGARADDLRGRGRPLVVPRQRPEPRRPAGAACVRAVPAEVVADGDGRRADPLRPVRARLRVVGAASCSSRSISTARGSGSTCARSASRPRRPTRWASTSPPTATRTRSSAARSPASAARASRSAITPQWVDGLTAGAGWIAIALVIFAFWRPALCLVGAYFFGAFSGIPFTFQARGILTASRRSSSRRCRT